MLNNREDMAPNKMSWWPSTIAQNYGLAYVGYYLTIAAGLTLLALLGSRKMMKEA
jgi:hypothetical protein